MASQSGLEVVDQLVTTWAIGLTPPLIIRYLVVRRPLRKRWAVAISFVFLIVNLALFIVTELSPATPKRRMLLPS